MGLLPLDPSKVGQMRRIGCCLVVVRNERRVFSIVSCGSSRNSQGHALMRGRLW